MPRTQWKCNHFLSQFLQAPSLKDFGPISSNLFPLALSLTAACTYRATIGFPHVSTASDVTKQTKSYTHHFKCPVTHSRRLRTWYLSNVPQKSCWMLINIQQLWWVKSGVKWRQDIKILQRRKVIIINECQWIIDAVRIEKVTEKRNAVNNLNVAENRWIVLNEHLTSGSSLLFLGVVTHCNGFVC